MKPKRKTTIVIHSRVPASIDEALFVVAEHHNTTKAHIIRTAIREYLESVAQK